MSRKKKPASERQVIIYDGRRHWFVSIEKAVEYREGRNGHYGEREWVHTNGGSYFFLHKDGSCQACKQGGCARKYVSVMTVDPWYMCGQQPVIRKRRWNQINPAKPTWTDRSQEFSSLTNMLGQPFLKLVEGDIGKIFQNIPEEEFQEVYSGIQQSMIPAMLHTSGLIAQPITEKTADEFYKTSGLPKPTGDLSASPEDAVRRRKQALDSLKGAAQENQRVVGDYLDHIAAYHPYWRENPQCVEHIRFGVQKFWERMLYSAKRCAKADTGRTSFYSGNVSKNKNKLGDALIKH